MVERRLLFDLNGFGIGMAVARGELDCFTTCEVPYSFRNSSCRGR
jgi:hypothetical protein